jgi:hypothetical protein
MSTKPQTYNADLARLPPALFPLTQLPCWVVWRWEQRANRGGRAKWTKPPYQARDQKHTAKSNDPTTWGRYDDALRAFGNGSGDGIGFMLKATHIGAADLDQVRDLQTGNVLRWAQELIGEGIGAGAYAEWTVSGCGARIIGIAHGPEVHRKVTFDRKTGAGVELYRDCARYITISGMQLPDAVAGPVASTLAVCDDLFDALYARYCAPAPGSGLDFNNAGLQSLAAYDDLIHNGVPEGSRSEAFAKVVWHLAGQGLSADEIADELARHPAGIAAKYHGRLTAEVARSYGKWQSHKQAAAAGAATAGAPWPQIRVIPGELPHIVDQAEDALLLLGREIYQRGGLCVRPVLSNLKASDDRDVQSWRLVPVTRPYLADTLTCAARFLRHDRRSEAWVATDAPNKVAETYLARQGRWKLPVLTGIIHTPFLRADGSLCEQPGYDPASGLLFQPDGQSFPSISPRPTKADALAALEMLS